MVIVLCFVVVEMRMENGSRKTVRLDVDKVVVGRVLKTILLKSQRCVMEKVEVI